MGRVQALFSFRMQKLAKELGLVIPVSFFKEANNAHYNSIAIIDADGTDLDLYRKSHIPDGPGYQEKFYFNPGQSLVPLLNRSIILNMAKLELQSVGINGFQRQPELWCYNSLRYYFSLLLLVLRLKMMDLILVWLLASNCIGKERIQTEHGNSEITFYGDSFVVGPIREIVAAAEDKEEAILVAKFDLGQIRAKRHSWGIFCDGHPNLYKVLLALDGNNPSL